MIFAIADLCERRKPWRGLGGKRGGTCSNGHAPRGGRYSIGSEGVKVHKMAVTEIPHSGKPEELIDRYGISARHIVEKVTKLVGSAVAAKT